MRRPLVALVAAAMLLIATIPSTAATTTKTPTAGTEMVIAVPDPGVTTVSGTVLSLRGMHDHAILAGSVVGIQEGWVNYDLDVVSFTGELWGTTDLVPTDLTDGGIACTWHGTFSPGTYGQAFTGKSVCHGYGSLKGLQSRSDISSIAPGTSSYVGYSFTPGI